MPDNEAQSFLLNHPEYAAAHGYCSWRSQNEILLHKSVLFPCLLLFFSSNFTTCFVFFDYRMGFHSRERNAPRHISSRSGWGSGCDVVGCSPRMMASSRASFRLVFIQIYYLTWDLNPQQLLNGLCVWPRFQIPIYSYPKTDTHHRNNCINTYNSKIRIGVFKTQSNHSFSKRRRLTVIWIHGFIIKNQLSLIVAGYRWNKG